jgi:predicted ATP-binding protein involved in virulence
MIIRELNLTNFRGFGGTREFKFAENFTVIAGVNGRGKTTIIDAIRYSAGRLIPQISKARGQYPKITKYDVNNNAIEGKFSIELVTNCAGYPLKFSVSYDWDANKVVPTRLPKAVAQNVAAAYGADPRSTDDAAPLVVVYTTDRASFRLPKKLPREIPPVAKAAFGGALVNRTVDYRDLAHRLRALEIEAIHPGETAQRMHRAMMHVVSTLLHGFDSLRLIENPLGILINKSGSTFELFQLSDGERSLFAMAADLSRRLTLANPRIDNPLEGSGVVLIDELELHLHPKWQRTISETLRTLFPNIQFICTTHSPFVIQSMREGEVINLDGQPVIEVGNLSVGTIARGLMGIDRPDVSVRYEEMVEVAKSYLLEIEEALNSPAERLAEFEKRLADRLEPYADNPAFQAFLELKREARLGPLRSQINGDANQ